MWKLSYETKCLWEGLKMKNNKIEGSVMEPSIPRVKKTKYFEVGIHEDNKTGWFQHHTYGDEFSGKLWFENNKLTDYDGISDFLPDEVIGAIVSFGFNIPYEFFENAEKADVKEVVKEVVKEKEKDDTKDEFLNALEKLYPVGTKILVEIEISKDTGYTELLNCLMNPKRSKELDDFIGVKINKIYRKDIEIPDDDVQTLLERALEKIKKHKEEGYSL